LTVTFIVLFGFSFLYFIQGPDSYLADEPSFRNAFFHVFAGFAGGFEEADSYLDVLFGLVLVIVLFNVVIAIVSSSWQTAVNASFINLCKHRIELIRRTEIDTATEGTWCNYWFCWWRHGLCCSLKKEMWIDRFDNEWNAVFTEESRPISGNQNNNNNKSKNKRWDAAYRCVVIVIKTLALVMFGALGLVTLGILWPTRIRKQLFQIHKNKDTMDMNVEHVVDATKTIGRDITSLHDKVDQGSSVMESRIDQLEHEVGQLREEMRNQMDDVNAKLDVALDYLIELQSASLSSPLVSSTTMRGPDPPLPARSPDSGRGGCRKTSKKAS
jgi:hypothetical protein